MHQQHRPGANNLTIGSLPDLSVTNSGFAFSNYSAAVTDGCASSNAEVAVGEFAYLA
jgi:hypothetical protein